LGSVRKWAVAAWVGVANACLRWCGGWVGRWFGGERGRVVCALALAFGSLRRTPLGVQGCLLSLGCFSPRSRCLWVALRCTAVLLATLLPPKQPLPLLGWCLQTASFPQVANSGTADAKCCCCYVLSSAICGSRVALPLSLDWVMLSSIHKTDPCPTAFIFFFDLAPWHRVFFAFADTSLRRKNHFN